MKRKRSDSQENEQSRRPGRQLIVLLVILAAALAFRLLLVAQVAAHPEIHSLVLDSAQYEEFGRHLLIHGSEHPDMAMMNPLYPVFLAAVWQIFGESRIAVGVIQALLDTGTAFLIFLMASRLFGRPTGLGAAATYALYGMAIFLSGLLLATTLVVFLLTASMVLLLRGVLDEHRWLLLPAGLLVAVAAFGRPTLILALAGVPLLYVLVHQGRTGIRKSMILLTIFGIGFALPMGWGALHNLRSSGRFSPFSANGGINFFIGNGPEANGGFHAPSGISDSPLEVVTTSIMVASQRAGRQLSPAEASSFWFDSGLAHLRSQPVAAFSLYIDKIGLFWGGREPPLNIDFDRARSMIPVLGLPLVGFGLVAPLGLLGLVLLFFQPRETWLVPLFILPFSASVIVFFVADRFRFPVVPLLIIAGAFTVVKAVTDLRRNNLKAVAVSLIAAFMLLLVVNRGGGEVDNPSRTAIHYHNLAKAHAQQGNIGLAEQEYRRAIAADPTHTKSLSNLGNILLLQDRLDEAMKLFTAARDIEPDFAGNTVNIGTIYFLRGDLTQAETEYRRAVTLADDSVEAHFNLGRVLFDSKRLDDAREQFLVTVDFDPEYAEAYFMLGGIAMATGRLDEAITAFQKTCTITPLHPSARYYLCLASANAGRLELAREQCEVARKQGHTLPNGVQQRLDASDNGP